MWNGDEKRSVRHPPNWKAMTDASEVPGMAYGDAAFDYAGQQRDENNKMIDQLFDEINQDL